MLKDLSSAENKRFSLNVYAKQWHWNKSRYEILTIGIFRWLSRGQWESEQRKSLTPPLFSVRAESLVSLRMAYLSKFIRCFICFLVLPNCILQFYLCPLDCISIKIQMSPGCSFTLLMLRSLILWSHKGVFRIRSLSHILALQGHN